jgi:4'-phosphopantetheinyl transferase
MMLLKLQKDFFSRDEVEVLKKIEKPEISTGFLNCWTRKEAFIKAIGEGLSYPLQDFSVSLKPGDEPEMLWIKKNPAEKDEWTLVNIDADKEYLSALAIQSRTAKLIYK